MKSAINPIPCFADHNGSVTLPGDGFNKPERENQSIQVVVTNSLGLHARPAAVLVRAASKFDCEISLSNGEDVVSAKSLIGILMLGASKGSVLTIEANCCKACEAIGTLKMLFENSFGEDD